MAAAAVYGRFGVAAFIILTISIGSTVPPPNDRPTPPAMQTGKLSAASGRFSRRSSVARGGVKKPGVGYDVESDTVTNDTVDATGGRPVWLLLLTLCLGNAGESVEVMKGGFMLPVRRARTSTHTDGARVAQEPTNCISRACVASDG